MLFVDNQSDLFTNILHSYFMDTELSCPTPEKQPFEHSKTTNTKSNISRGTVWRKLQYVMESDQAMVYSIFTKSTIMIWIGVAQHLQLIDEIVMQWWNLILFKPASRWTVHLMPLCNTEQVCCPKFDAVQVEQSKWWASGVLSIIRLFYVNCYINSSPPWCRIYASVNQINIGSDNI